MKKLLACFFASFFFFISAAYASPPADEILIGTTQPLSGPASSYSVGANTQAAYFTMINDQGGVNGRKIRFIILDDAYNPAKTVEQTRRLVESDKVFAVFSALGTATNASVQKYLNDKKIPQILIFSGNSQWNNPAQYPWTIAFNPSHKWEAKAFAKYILKNYPKAKVGILYQNDDFGKDLLSHFKESLGKSAENLIVKEQSYEVTSPTISSQILNLKNAGVDVLVTFAIRKFAVQTITQLNQLNWHPVHILNGSGASEEDFKKAGFEKAQNVISATFIKMPAVSRWANDPAVRDYKAFMAKYYPNGNGNDPLNLYAYLNAQLLVEILKKCGNNLTRENFLEQATHLNVALPGFLPGVRFRTTPTDYSGVSQLQLMQFKGAEWVPISGVVDER